MEPDEPTPTRPSRNLAVFATACQQAMNALDALGLDQEGGDIRREAADMFMVIEGWKRFPPDDQHRRKVIERVIDIDRRMKAYLARRAQQLQPK